MKIYKSNEIGISGGADITQQLNRFLRSIENDNQPKTLELENTQYHIDADFCVQDFLYMTNTCADHDWKKGETPYLAKIAIYIKNTNNFTIKGNGATFIINGQCTNMAINNCNNIRIEDIEIKVTNPNLHEYTVRNKGLFYTDFELDRDSVYGIDNGVLYHIGKDYRVRADKNAAGSWWNGMSPSGDPNAIWRVRHPFLGAIRYKELGPYNIRVFSIHNRRFRVGDRYYIFDKRRNNAGIFVNESSNIELYKIAQRFNYGLAVVAQVSQDITLDSLDLSPCKSSHKTFTSVADFIQICECKGDVNIINSRFAGAGDDCLNVHGVHFRVDSIQNNTIEVSFRHKETKGYNPFKAGETIQFIDPKTLLPRGSAKVISGKLLDDISTIRLEIDNTDGLEVGQVIDNITRHPRLLFQNNFMTKIITRGILVTTSARSVVKDNVFDNTSMHSILCSDDANNWYESGRVLDLTIQSNTFNTCKGKYNFCIMPENKAHGGYVHQNIKILDNIINTDGGGLYLKSAGDIVFKGNIINGKGFKKDITNSSLQED